MYTTRIHMNGRVYDPVIGRFLSADPFVQDPFSSQSYNRYSYGWNNPLSGTDPSGYTWFLFGLAAEAFAATESFLFGAAAVTGASAVIVDQGSQYFSDYSIDNGSTYSNTSSFIGELNHGTSTETPIINRDPESYAMPGTAMHILGIQFKDGASPPLSGLLALLVLYFSLMLIISTYQEVKAWLAQADSLDFSGSRRNLHDIYAHHQNIDNAIKSVTDQLDLHALAAVKLTEAVVTSDYVDERVVESNLNSLEVHKQSFENMCNNLRPLNDEFGAEIAKAKKMYHRASTNYKSAMRTQIAKVGFLEIVVPMFLASMAIYLSHGGISQVVSSVFR